MGIQINGQTDTISATDGSLNIAGTVAVNVTGDATGLTGTPNVNVGVLTAASAVISGNLQVDGTTTTLDTLLTEVDKLEVGANNTTVGVAITQSGTGDILRLYDGATQVVTVKDGGSVGIGTDNPQAILHVRGSSSPRIENTGTISLIRFQNSSFENVFFGSDTDNAVIYTQSTEKFRITSTGNIGIGTDSPFSTNGTNLEVAHHTSSGSCRLLLRNTNGSGLRYYIQSQNDGALTFGDVSNGERLRITDGGQVRIGNSTITVSNSADDLIIGLDSPGGDRGITVISGTSGTGNIFFSDTDTSGVGNRMGTITYDHSGNFMRFSTAGNNERLRITSGGNVGIGTNNPGDKLTVYNPNNGNPTGITIRNTEASSTYSHARLRLESQNAAAYAEIWADVANSALRLGYNSSSTVNINSSGRITAPERIYVGETYNISNVSGSIGGSGGGQDYIGLRHGTTFGLMLKTAGTNVGNVGIGTDSPGDKLTIHQGSDDDIIVRVNGLDSTTEFAGLGVGSGYASFVAGGSGTTSTDLVLFTTTGGTETERLRITSDGSLYHKGDNSNTANNTDADSGNSSGYPARGATINKNVFVTNSSYYGQGMMMVSHTKTVTLNGSTNHNMIEIINREGCFIGHIYAGYSTSGDAAVAMYKFHAFYAAAYLTAEISPQSRTSDTISVNVSSANDRHTIRVNGNGYSGPVTVGVICLSVGTHSSNHFGIRYF